MAGTTETNQIPFFIAACDYVIIGDEFYAASAYLSRDPNASGQHCRSGLLQIAAAADYLARPHLDQPAKSRESLRPCGSHALHWVVDFLKVKIKLAHVPTIFCAPAPARAAYFGKMALGFCSCLLSWPRCRPRHAGRKREIIAFFTFLGGLYFATEFFWPTRPAKEL